jgi:biotin carboxyl carrier protein
MRRYRIEVAGRAFEVDVDDVGADRFQVVVEGRRFDVALGGAHDVAAAAPVAGGRVSVADGDALTAPMPGRILRVAVAEGATVQRGQDIAVLEAMKMENVIRAPRDGRIAAVCVQVGQQVAHGEAVVRYAKAGS